MAVLDPETVDRFAANGYVATPRFFSEPDLDRFALDIDAEVTRRTADDTRSLSEKSSYEQSFVQCMRLWETAPAVAAITFHTRLAQAAAELLGVERVRVWQDQALYKEPGGRITDPHQDATFWPIGDTPLVSAWIPLDGSTIEGGAVGYVSGSHKLGALKMVNLTKTTDAYDLLSDPALEGKQPTYVEAMKGTVVWHHGMTVHAALANNSDVTRRAFTVVYIADGYRRVKPWPNFPLDRAGVQVGDVMEGEGLPVAWPREPGDHPRPPTTIGSPTGPQVLDRS